MIILNIFCNSLDWEKRNDTLDIVTLKDNYFYIKVRFFKQ